MKTILFATFLLVVSCIYSQKKIAVIGGGIAGVSAAHYFHKYNQNLKITVFEKEAQLGGNAQTVEVTTTDGRKRLIDAGPQYFTKGPWDDYISFLEETIGFDKIGTESMAGTLIVQRTTENTPLIVTPLNGKLRGEKLGKLLKLKKFNTEAYNVYKNPEPWREKNIEEWVRTLDFTEQYKTEIIYPFLAASLGTTVNDIKTTSTVEIVSLFAFRKPKASNTFQIMKDGMGGLIQQIGKKLEQAGVVIKTNSPVQFVEQTERGYVIHYLSNGKIIVEEADYVVMAVHADVAAKLLQKSSSFDKIASILAQLPYFDAHIVLHQDPSYINAEKPAFLNIFTNTNNELAFSTMNLSIISPRLEGIYKSWMSAEDTKKVREKGLLLHETTFCHPMITPDFVAKLMQLKQLVSAAKGVSIIGGWTEGLETQNSAVVSAKRALEEYKMVVN